MKKEYRLKKEKDIQNVFYHKNSKANKQFIVYLLEKKNQQHCRICLSVSKKLGNAVIRNNIKRKIRVAIKNLSDDIKENYDIIIIARQPIITMDVESIQNSLLHVFKLSQIIK